MSDLEIFILIPLSACLTLLIITLIMRRFKHVLFSDNYDSSVLDTATQNTMSGAYVVLGFVLVLAMTTLYPLLFTLLAYSVFWVSYLFAHFASLRLLP